MMLATARQVETALRGSADPEKAALFPRFFKAGPGQYAEGDQFFGVVVPKQRKIAKEFKDLPIEEINKLLDHPVHECRLTALFVLVGQFEKAKNNAKRKAIYDFYLKNINQVNNWDLVDASAHKIVGPFLQDRSRQPLYKLAKASHLWKNRVAMVATFHYIRAGDLDDALAIAEILTTHQHDLIHKAVGWMLREVGKQNKDAMLGFLEKHAPNMARVTLRYAIEKLPTSQRKAILARFPAQRSSTP